MTPVHYSVVTENLEMLEFLLKNEADAGCKNGFDETPKDIAVKRGQAEILNLLSKCFQENMTMEE